MPSATRSPAGSGAEPALPAVATGSHIDAIPHSGRYDGTVGVLGALEAIRALQDAGFRPRRSIELILFTSEEPTRFGIGCLGSRLLSGTLDPGAGGMRFRTRRARASTRFAPPPALPGRWPAWRCRRDSYHAFVELHIEQGPLLERGGIPLGVVTAIAAPATLRIEIEGEGGHAGAVLMPDRHDAFAAAAEIALAVEAAAKSTGAVDTRGDGRHLRGLSRRGQQHPQPRTHDGRRPRYRSGAPRRGACRRPRALRRGCGGARRHGALRSPQCRRARAIQRPGDRGSAKAACEELQLPCTLMVSRAYHDSLFMSRIAPTAMLFIPCRGGVSHRPDEFASARRHRARRAGAGARAGTVGGMRQDRRRRSRVRGANNTSIAYGPLAILFRVALRER